MKFHAVTFSAAVAASVILSGCCCGTFDAKFNVGMPNEKVEVSKAAGKVSVDGVLGRNEWKGATVYNMVRAYQAVNPKITPAKVLAHTSRKNKDVEPFEGGSVRLMYDKNFLYVGAQLTDKDINQLAIEDQGKNHGTGDTLIVYLKPANSPSFWEIQATPNSKKTSFFNATRGYPINPDTNVVMPGLKVRAKIQGTFNNYFKADKGWTVEMAIPVKELKKAGCEFKPGQAWTILIGRYNYNFNVNDVAPQYSCYPEMPTNSFTHIEYYGDINWK